MLIVIHQCWTLWPIKVRSISCTWLFLRTKTQSIFITRSQGLHLLLTFCKTTLTINQALSTYSSTLFWLLYQSLQLITSRSVCFNGLTLGWLIEFSLWLFWAQTLLKIKMQIHSLMWVTFMIWITTFLNLQHQWTLLFMIFGLYLITQDSIADFSWRTSLLKEMGSLL